MKNYFFFAFQANQTAKEESKDDDLSALLSGKHPIFSFASLDRSSAYTRDTMQSRSVKGLSRVMEIGAKFKDIKGRVGMYSYQLHVQYEINITKLLSVYIAKT